MHPPNVIFLGDICIDWVEITTVIFFYSGIIFSRMVLVTVVFRLLYDINICTMWYFTLVRLLNLFLCALRCSGVKCYFLVFLTNITISILFHLDNHDYYWDVYVHCYSFWTTDLGFSTLGNYTTIPHIPWCFCPWNCFKNIGLNKLLSGPVMSNLYSQLEYSPGSSELCNWLSLRCLVPWINHLPPVSWSDFW